MCMYEVFCISGYVLIVFFRAGHNLREICSGAATIRFAFFSGSLEFPCEIACLIFLLRVGVVYFSF